MSRTSDQKPRVLAALRANPGGICQGDFIDTPAIDGKGRISRVAARIEDLENDGHKITVIGRRNRYAVYKLVSDAGDRAAPAPPGPAPPLTAAPPLDRRKIVMPTFHVCDDCGYRFKGPEWPQACPSCQKPPHWLCSFHEKSHAIDYVPLCDRVPLPVAA